MRKGCGVHGLWRRRGRRPGPVGAVRWSIARLLLLLLRRRRLERRWCWCLAGSGERDAHLFRGEVLGLEELPPLVERGGGDGGVLEDCGA